MSLCYVATTFSSCISNQPLMLSPPLFPSFLILLLFEYLCAAVEVGRKRIGSSRWPLRNWTSDGWTFLGHRPSLRKSLTVKYSCGERAAQGHGKRALTGIGQSPHPCTGQSIGGDEWKGKEENQKSRGVKNASKTRRRELALMDDLQPRELEIAEKYTNISGYWHYKRALFITITRCRQHIPCVYCDTEFLYFYLPVMYSFLLNTSGTLFWYQWTFWKVWVF